MRQPMNCKSCLTSFTPPTSNTKYCDMCRVLRDLDFYQGKLVRKCTACGVTFYPLRNTWRRCPNCSVYRGTGEVECHLCKQYNELAPGTNRTCIFCISSSKVYYHDYWKALSKLVGLMIKANQTMETKRPPEPPAQEEPEIV